MKAGTVLSIGSIQKKSMMTNHNEQLQEMLDEVREIREGLAKVSESAQRITEAIHAMLEVDETGPDLTSDDFEQTYRVLHEDL